MGWWRVFCESGWRRRKTEKWNRRIKKERKSRRRKKASRRQEMGSSQACVYSQLYVLEKVGDYSIYRWENVEWRNNREQKKKNTSPILRKRKKKQHKRNKKRNQREKNIETIFYAGLHYWRSMWKAKGQFVHTCPNQFTLLPSWRPICLMTPSSHALSCTTYICYSYVTTLNVITCLDYAIIPGSPR